MNTNYYVKCRICNSITRVKLQVGWMDEHPVAVWCGRCHVLLNGTAIMDQENVRVRMQFKNADLIFDEKISPDFFQETSGEFPTFKLVNEGHEISMLSSARPPFIRNAYNDNINRFRHYSRKMINLNNTGWYDLNCIFELWKNSENNIYLENALKNNNIFPVNAQNDECHIPWGIHQLFVNVSHCMIDKEKCSDISTTLDKLSTIHPHELDKFKNRLQTQDYLINIKRKIFDLLDQFVKIFPNFIPAYCIYIENKSNDFNYLNEGITTTSFELVKNFYVDCYELLADLVPILIGLDNILKREHFDCLRTFLDKKSIIGNYEELFSKPNPIKVRFYDQYKEEINLIDIDFNYLLRNSIGHYDYFIESQNQVIYYNKNISNVIDTNKFDKKIYLLEFTVECLNLFQNIIFMENIIYFIETSDKINLYLNEESMIDSDFNYNNFQESYMKNSNFKYGDLKSLISSNTKTSTVKKEKKHYPNELCYCGSGKKFKYCHGKK